MLGSNFYNSLMYKYNIMFGSFFDDMTISRLDKNKKLVTSINVPIVYSPKRKWVMAMNETLNKEVSIQFPRMGFEFTGMQFDLTRKVSPLNVLADQYPSMGYMLNTYNSIPYKLSAELFIGSKNADDAAQIVEQILPYFQPDFTMSLKLIPELDYTFDIKTTLMSINKDDIYDGEFIKRQVILWSLQFEIDALFFGPIRKQGVIKKVIVDYHVNSGSSEDIDLTVSPVERYTLQPGLTPDGLPTGNITQSIPYQDINVTDNYGFIETVESISQNGAYNSTYYDANDYYNSGIEINGEVLTVSGNYATTFFVNQNQNISNINILEWNKQELIFYIKQDETGGWSIDGFPENTTWPVGTPSFTTVPNGTNKITLVSPDKGITIYANLQVY